MKYIEKEEIRKLLDNGRDFMLVNVLSRESFAKVHIPGSINIPLKEEDFEGRFESIIPDRKSMIVVHCSSPD